MSTRQEPGPARPADMAATVPVEAASAEPADAAPTAHSPDAAPTAAEPPAAAHTAVDASTARPSDRPGRTVTEAQLESLLFVAERPLSRREIASLAGVSTEQVDGLLGDLEVSLGARGIRLVTSGDQVALATAPEAAELVGRYVGGDPARLSPAMLETLAIVAYRQPVTRALVERIRGVDSDYVLRALLHRRLVVELGRAPAPGRPFLYGTGYGFLERFGLTSLDGLPPLEAEVAERLLAGGPGDGALAGIVAGEAEPLRPAGAGENGNPAAEPAQPDDA
jgi:segregation and condensation protein B